MNDYDVLVVDAGGRGHALAWLISHSGYVNKVYVAPGNPGIDDLEDCTRVPIGARETQALVRFALDHRIDLAVIGLEDPICQDGLADALRQAGIATFAPSQAAAMVESSKSWALRLMFAAKIPTVSWFRVFTSFPEAAKFIANRQGEMVVKADGLAAGKGVVVCATPEQALGAAKAMLVDGVHGKAGRKIVITERLHGEEASYMVITDGRRFIPLPLAGDHKPLLDGDKGPNTGGMGSFAPSTALSRKEQAFVRQHVVRPLLRELASRGRPYVGCLYIGLMKTPGGIKVIEINCRFGDPETQAQVMLMNADDFVQAIYNAAQGRLQKGQAIGLGRHRAAVCTVKVSLGYPGHYETGKVVSGIRAVELSGRGIEVFHAGTVRKGKRLHTAGGRVVGVTAGSEDMVEAVRLSQAAARLIHFSNQFQRSDIGQRELNRRNRRK